jgi:3-oxoacyl-[acyl-carrier-protein] synthase-3
VAVVIAGIGAFYPDNVLTNQQLSKMVDTSDEWISTRTGIRERRIVPRGDATTASDMGALAAEAALKKAGLSAGDLDGIIAAGLNPDKNFPATACFIQQKIGAGGFAFDVTAACAGFVFGLNIGAHMIQTGQCRNLLVVGAELISPIIDWTDRNTCVLFGDAAGAVVLSAYDDESRGVLASCLKSKGAAADILYLNNKAKNGEGPYLRMDGKQVFKLAVKALSNIIPETLNKVKLSVDEVDLAVFHQANYRIIKAVAAKLGLPEKKLILNGCKFGNTSSASIPLALADAERAGKLAPGKLVVLAAIGGGMSWGCNVIRW